MIRMLMVKKTAKEVWDYIKASHVSFKRVKKVRMQSLYQEWESLLPAMVSYSMTLRSVSPGS